MSDIKTLKEKLVAGTNIRLGKKYCEGRPHRTEGEILILVEGDFEYDNGLYCEQQQAPAVWDDEQGEYDSIYHLFGNDLEDFEDCTIVKEPPE